MQTLFYYWICSKSTNLQYRKNWHLQNFPVLHGLTVLSYDLNNKYIFHARGMNELAGYIENYPQKKKQKQDRHLLCNFSSSKLLVIILNSTNHFQRTIRTLDRIPFTYLTTNTAWKVSIFGLFLVRIFSHANWIRWDTSYLSIFSPNTEKYGPENSEYGYFSRSASLRI